MSESLEALCVECVRDALALSARASSHTKVLLNHRADAFRSPIQQRPFNRLGYEFY